MKSLLTSLLLLSSACLSWAQPAATTYNIRRVAGGGSYGFPSDNGLPATSSSIANASDFALDKSGNLYIVQSYNCLLRKVSAGILSTLAGTGARPGVCSSTGDSGPAVNANLELPTDVAVDGQGLVYVAEAKHLRVIVNGSIWNLAGDGRLADRVYENAFPATVPVAPTAVAARSSTEVFFASANWHVVQQLSLNGLSRVAGASTTTPLSGFSGDGGPASRALLASPNDVAVDSAGNLYIADTNNCLIRKVSGGIITTIAGKGTCGFSGDNGPATKAELSLPRGVAVDSAGNVYVSDYGNSRIRKIVNGVITTIAGGGSRSLVEDCPALQAELQEPTKIQVDDQGNVYYLDIFGYGDYNPVIRVLTPSGSGGAPSGALVLPQFVFGGAWTTAMYFSNMSASTVSFPVDFYGDDGLPLLVPSLNSYSTTITIPPYGTSMIEASSPGVLKQGFAMFTAPPGVSGYGVFRQDAGGAQQEAVVPFSSAASTSSLLTWDDRNLTSAVALVNPSSVTASITITAKDFAGATLGTAVISLPPRNHTATVLSDLPGLAALKSRFGSAQFTAQSGAVAVLGLRFRGLAFTSIPAGSTVSAGGTILPQFVFGGGWTTSLYFTNSSPAPVTFPVGFFSSSGVPLPVPSLGGSSVLVAIPAGGTAMLEAPNAGNLNQGYGSFNLPAGVTGYGVFRQTAGGADQEAVVPFASASGTNMVLAWDERSLTSGIAVVNPGSSSARIAVTARNLLGNVVGSTVLDLPAKTHTAAVLSGFTGMASIGGQFGTAQFVAESGNVAVLGLRFRGLALTSIPSAAATVVPPPGLSPPVISAFTASPSSINSGQTVSLSWSVSNATSLSINNGIGVVTGSSRSVAPAATTTYTLTATNASGSVSASVTVVVNTPPSPPSISSFTATPSAILAGQSSTLSWTVSNATALSIDGGIGTVTGSSLSVTPASTTTYILTASNGAGSVTASVTVTVSVSAPPPTINSFIAAPSTITAGQSATLSWIVSNATSISIDNGIGAVTSPGFVTVNPSASTTYTLTAFGPGGSATASATVAVVTACAVNGGTPSPTLFIANTGGVLPAQGSWWVQQFTVPAQSTFDFRIAADYVIQAGIFTADQYSAFTNNQSYVGYGLFDRNYGTQSVTLAPGTYYVGIRNVANGSNTYTLELDLPMSIPGATLLDTYLNEAQYVSPNGGKLWQPFTVQCGYRYLIDGSNSGLQSYVIEASQLSAFQNGQAFYYYTDYSSDFVDPSQPGFFEITLPPGNYYLVFTNPAAISKSVVYTMKRYR